MARISSGKLSFRTALRIDSARKSIGGQEVRTKSGKYFYVSGNSSNIGVAFSRKELLKGQRRAVKMKFGSSGLKRMGL